MARLIVALALGLCAHGCKTAAPPKPVTTVTFTVSKGEVLGTLTVPPGGPCQLKLAGDSTDAKSLAALIDKIGAGPSFRVKMHMPAEDGKRGAYGARIFEKGKPDYADGVKLKLQSELYQVKVKP